MLESPPTDDLARDLAGQLDLLADAHDRYALIAAIERCDRVVAAVRNVQLIHSQNLCRVANHLAFGDRKCGERSPGNGLTCGLPPNHAGQHSALDSVFSNPPNAVLLTWE